MSQQLAKLLPVDGPWALGKETETLFVDARNDDDFKSAECTY